MKTYDITKLTDELKSYNVRYRNEKYISLLFCFGGVDRLLRKHCTYSQ